MADESRAKAINAVEAIFDRYVAFLAIVCYVWNV